MQVENTPSLARKKSKVHEDDLISSFSDCTSGTYQTIRDQGPQDAVISVRYERAWTDLHGNQKLILIVLKVSSLGSTTTEEFEGEGGTIGSVTTDSDVRQSNEKSGKVKTFRMVQMSCFSPYHMDHMI